MFLDVYMVSENVMSEKRSLTYVIHKQSRIIYYFYVRLLIYNN